MPISAELATPATNGFRWDGAAWNPLGDLRVRYGIKVGAAAVLALWIAQALRLEHPSWSVLAALVLANAHYVGATASKALMRSVGTVAGALLGIWVVGNFVSTFWAFTFWVFVVVAVAAYKSGQLASAAVPYAYYLTGLTLDAVATYGVSDPNNVWRIALYRTLETLVGVVSATFVYALLWPRHAREEFVTGAGEALKTVVHGSFPVGNQLQEALSVSLSMGSIWPEMDLPASDARNTANAAITVMILRTISPNRESCISEVRFGLKQRRVLARTPTRSTLTKRINTKALSTLTATATNSTKRLFHSAASNHRLKGFLIKSAIFPYKGRCQPPSAFFARRPPVRGNRPGFCP
jgi:hypothetical protein